MPTTTLTPGPAGLDPWALALDQVVLRDGLRLVAVEDRDPGDPAARGSWRGWPEREVIPDMADQPQPDRSAQTPRVLLVDDSPAMRTVLRGLLEDAGIVVVGEAEDGLEGVAQAAAVRPDVVLMDWRMPRLDGVQATARIRDQLPEVQVVMFSSLEGAGIGAVARQAGATAFVSKGSSPEQLCAAVLTAWRPPAPPLS